MFGDDYGLPPIEPSADLREFASSQMQMYVALTNEGFDEQQAMAILKTTLAAAIGAQGRR